jgi:hypothetical protein
MAQSFYRWIMAHLAWLESSARSSTWRAAAGAWREGGARVVAQWQKAVRGQRDGGGARAARGRWEGGGARVERGRPCERGTRATGRARGGARAPASVRQESAGKGASGEGNGGEGANRRKERGSGWIARGSGCYIWLGRRGK